MQTITEICEHTPLVKLKNIVSSNQAEICLKLENMNGSGSIKVRPAKYIIEQAEKNGQLKPGGTIIESSSGNFGIACAMIGAAKGYRVIMVIDPKTTPANRALLKIYGAELAIMDKPDDDGAYHKSRISFANRLAQEIPGAFRPDQCFNMQNGNAHYLSTAPEILAQCNGKIDALILSVSTGGQAGGMARFFHEHSPHTKIIAIEPIGSSIFGGDAHSYLLPGIGLSWTPTNITHLNYLDSVYKVPDEDAFLTCRLLAKKEGILIGGSTGANIFLALKLSEKMGPDKRIVCIASDGGERYIDTIYNDRWMQARHLKTNCTVHQLYERANELTVYSQNPVENANYKPHLINELRDLADNVSNDSPLLNKFICKNLSACIE
jgi:cystathionine beta-synthase/cysteine synthase A